MTNRPGTQRLYAGSHKDRHIPKDSAGAYLAENIAGEIFEKNVFPKIGVGHAYTAASWTVTTGGTGIAVAEASTAGGGILITCPSDDGFNAGFQSVQLWTPAANKVVACFARFSVADVDKTGFYIGLGDSKATNLLPFSTEFTDGVMIRKAITATAIVGAAVGNGGTLRSTATLATATDGAIYDVGFWFRIGSSATVGTAGKFYVNGTWTPFTALQCAELYAMLTTPASVYFTVGATGTTGTNQTMTVISAACEVDN